MEVNDLLIEMFDRVSAHVHGVVEGLDVETLSAMPAPGINPIGWLVWHLTRVQDHHVAELLDVEQLWVDGSWAHRFGIEPDPHNNGYGHTADEVASIRPDSAAALTEYYDAVWARTRAFLEGLRATDLDRVVDERWDPPVTLGVRLVSIADDDVQHAGQAAYAKGLLASR